MKIYFSESTKSFYPENFISRYAAAGSLPDDLIEATDGEVGAYFCQSFPEGKEIGSYNGRPVWVDIPSKTTDELAADERRWRDGELLHWDADIYRNQFYWAGLSAAEQAARIEYRQSLLDYPEKPGFPTDKSLRPVQKNITG